MKRKLAVATVAAVALVGAGSVAAVAGDDGTRPAAPSVRAHDRGGHKDDGRESGKDDGRDGSRAAKSAATTAAEAAEAALKAAPGTVTGIELDDDGQSAVWEVEVLKDGASHEIRLDGDAGKVLGEKTEQDRETVPASKFTAADVARKAAGRGAVTSVELDDDAKAATWEVEVTAEGGETELTVDGRSGEISRAVADHKDDDRDGSRDGDD